MLDNSLILTRGYSLMIASFRPLPGPRPLPGLPRRLRRSLRRIFPYAEHRQSCGSAARGIPSRQRLRICLLHHRPHRRRHRPLGFRWIYRLEYIGEREEKGQ